MEKKLYRSRNGSQHLNFWRYVASFGLVILECLRIVCLPSSLNSVNCLLLQNKGREQVGKFLFKLPLRSIIINFVSKPMCLHSTVISYSSPHGAIASFISKLLFSLWVAAMSFCTELTSPSTNFYIKKTVPILQHMNEFFIQATVPLHIIVLNNIFKWLCPDRSTVKSFIFKLLYPFHSIIISSIFKWLCSLPSTIWVVYSGG